MSEVEQDVAADAFRGVEPLRRGPVTVTGHNVDKNALTPVAQRKRVQREREKEAGVEVFELKLGPTERLMLLEGRVNRGSKGVPYTATEYLLTLIRRDHELILQQREVVAKKICAHCRKPMPRGCGGVWAGELPCVLPQLERALWL